MSDDFTDHAKLKHRKEIGIDAEVGRHVLGGGGAQKSSDDLWEIGEFIKKHGPDQLRHCEHIGSTAVHIFQSEMLGHMFFITQTNGMAKVPETTADLAHKQLKLDLMEKVFARKAPKLRSGF